MKTKETAAFIIDWMKDYALQSNLKGFVVGISGGIDSALTSALAARTGLQVLLVEMPIHQESSQVQRGRKHINSLIREFKNVERVEVELSTVFDQMVDAFPFPVSQDNLEMSLVNTRARLRMTCLYYFAGLNSMIVAGTGNKVEDFGIGFFTKYGDGGVDISPIADLNKTEVYAIAKELGVDSDIIKAPPTDGLWGDDRTDEDQIGATYPELEWAMEFKGDESDLSDRQKTVLSIYRRYQKMNRHKMLPIPVCHIPEELKN